MIIVRYTTLTSVREAKFANPVLAAKFTQRTLRRERDAGKVIDVKVRSVRTDA